MEALLTLINFIKIKNLKYINKYGDFKTIININGKKIGLWISKSGNYQFSEKYNSNGNIKYYSYGDYENDSLIGSLKFIGRLKKN